MYNIAILDDNELALDVFKDEVSSFFKNKAFHSDVYIFTSPLNFLAAAKEKIFELVFLDIGMPLKNGIDVGKELVAQYPNINLIFLSSREDLVFDCFALHPFGFIRKSKFKQDFASVMEQYNASILSLVNNDERIDFVRKNSVTSYKVNEIVYIEGFRNYQELHLKNGNKELIRISMNELEIKLKPSGFIRTQKGFLVNYLFIRTISNNEIVLLNGDSLPISKKRREDILKEYLNISRNKNLLMKV